MLYQRCAMLFRRSFYVSIRRCINVQRRINVISTLIDNVETPLIRRWNVGWDNSSYPNVIEKQRDTVLKSSNASKFITQHFDFAKQKTEFTSKHFENPKLKIYSNENSVKNDPNNKKQISNKTVGLLNYWISKLLNSFIDELVEFEEIMKGNDCFSAHNVSFYNVSLKLEI